MYHKTQSELASSFKEETQSRLGSHAAIDLQDQGRVLIQGGCRVVVILGGAALSPFDWEVSSHQLSDRL